MPEGPEPDPRGVGSPTPGNSVPKDILPTPEDAEAPTPGELPCSGKPGKLETPMPEGSLRPGGDPLGPKVGSTPEARAGSFPEGRGKADARKFASGNGLRRSERSGCGCRKLRSHRPESRPAKNSALSVSRPRRPRETTPRTSSVQAARGRPGQCFKALMPGACPCGGAGARERHCRRTRRPALRLRECRRAGPSLLR